ncbi:type II toxin-antitoxin system VapC family toxin [Phytomonospora endophytica]|uniref:Ribonuclease VapC n=1 Tax=Phytomonospora endophytica TaxID=714109 RepID=A0A841FSG2_9ACTN|nr:type II toxin-antitoxin system VapC family toxin [Phytomonospora endophytica]MBB6039205.1 putative nucleic acid-binding protein [Phytomonospora endophytica]GIG67558.1 VapC ribonuclease [Phytomonospora endophytica]
MSQTIVVDNSVIVYALTESAGTELLRRRLSAPRQMHAPALIDFEFLSAMRGMLVGRKITEVVADQALRDFFDLPITRHPGAETFKRAWELRHNYNPYDASYVALAESLGSTLLTSDRKLEGSHSARVEVIAI